MPPSDSQVKGLGGTPVRELQAEEVQAAQTSAAALSATLAPEGVAAAAAAGPAASVSGSSRVDTATINHSSSPCSGSDCPENATNARDGLQQTGGAPQEQSQLDHAAVPAGAGGICQTGMGGDTAGQPLAAARGRRGDGDAGMASLMEELSQLRESYLLLQEEYWRQKEKLLELDIGSKQLERVATDAVHKAEKVRAQPGGQEGWVGVLGVILFGAWEEAMCTY